MYRIKEIHKSQHFSELTIQRRIYFIWWNVTVDDKYLSSLSEARNWIKMKMEGYAVTNYYYD